VSEQLERAGRVIADLRRKLAELSGAGTDPVAIIGMACRFPGGANDGDAFWRIVRNGEVAVRPRGSQRPAAVLDDVAGFDPAFFDISPREAMQMDPQQRLFLEVAWDALEDAGQTREGLAESDTGTFAGVHNHSGGYYELQKSLGATNEFTGVGSGHDVIAGRLAYFLNLHGPSAVVNTACSSSLVAFHLASAAVLAGDCRMAIAGGVNLLLGSSETFLSEGGMLAPDGHCKTFDARADGFGRGEGCGVVILKRLSHARADRDRVLAIVRATAVNQDGRTNGLTAPSGLAQQALLRRALAKSGLNASDITYVEAHGTGTALGDPIEVEAIAEVYGAADASAPPLALGSAKANINHLEGAAGVAGIIKTVLALRARTIPPVAGFEQLNPELSLAGTRLFVPREATAWETHGVPRVATVSSFGWSGVNAHVILQEAAPEDGFAPRAPRPLIVVASTADPRSLPARLAALAARLDELPDEQLEDFAWTATVRRSHFDHRVAVVGTSRHTLIEALRTRAAQDDAQTSRTPRAGALPGDGDERLETPDTTLSAEQLGIVARRYEAGRDVNWGSAFAGDARLISLPPYPFRKRRFWVADAFETPASETAPGESMTAPDDWFYETAWQRPEDAASAAPPAFDRWLILADRSGFGTALGRLARESGDDVQIVAHDAQDALDAEFAHADRAERRTAVVDLRALDATADEPAAEALRLAQRVLELERTIAERDWKQPPALFVVTRGAQAPLPFEPPANVAAANLWGLGRCLSLEHPGSWGGLIDLDPVASPGDARALFDELRRAASQTETALRNGERLVARLEPMPAPGGVLPELHGDATYVVTGAFGAVGTRLAGWLAERGAKHLVLIGRASASGTGAERVQRDLHARGVRARLETCDVGDAVQLEALWSRIAAELPPVRGIFHAAGATEKTATLDAGDLAAAFRAKVDGTLALDRVSAAQPLDFFVCFSSGAATIGDRGRAAYGAANAFMDALVADRRARGAAGLSINWGLWSGRDESAPDVQLFLRSGLVSMPLGAAFDALGRLMSAGESRVNWRPMVASIDAPRLVAALALRGRTAFLSALAPAQPAASPAAAGQLVDLIRRAEASEREPLLAAAIAREVRAVLELADDDLLDADRGFFDLGMDSLMTVALKGRLERAFGVSLLSTLTLEYPTVATLTEYLGRTVVGDARASANGAPASAASVAKIKAQAAVDDLDDLDDADVAAALAAELRALGLELQG
jgi:acyl transferase domain-containing protein/acyl carrier protein